MKNIILIGMPGTGKSVVGQALAQRMNYQFVDVDDLIQARSGKTLKEMLLEMGYDGFLSAEGYEGMQLSCQDTVISTGGSMVFSAQAMEHLKENGVVVWLETPISELESRMPEQLIDRGIACAPGMTIRDIYRQREPLYAQYADAIVACCKGEDNVVDRLLSVIHGLPLD